MDSINEIVALNLKELRERRKMSLDTVSSATGVSKSMLGQIERGEVNPTISTVWKIANGLKVSFTELISKPNREIELIDTAKLEPMLEDEGRYRNFPLFPFVENKRFETYYIELLPGCLLEAEAHPPGTEEFVTVFSGALTVTVSSKTMTVRDRMAVRFQADRAHSYHNDGEELCRISMVIYYPKE